MPSHNNERESDVTVLASVNKLWDAFTHYSTTHGLQRIADSVEIWRKLIWLTIFLASLAGCLYHCSYIINSYLKFRKVTTAEEIHSKELDFPALTVCNFNILKNQFLEDQLNINKNNTSGEQRKGFCFKSEKEFIDQSQAKDLSDIWSKLGITADHLRKYGHKVYDLIVQCSYNNADCFNQSITRTLPMETENIAIKDYISSKLGYCHTIILNPLTLGTVRRAGQTRGLTLTLNIERDQYLDILSPEYGVRLMIHQRQAYPTIERGGIALHPGTKTYISIRMRNIIRLPAPYGDCTKSFDDSPVTSVLKKLDKDFVLKHEYYTYEYCQALCRETLLLSNCSCVEEQLNANHKFCNPCDKDQEYCRSNFTHNFTSNENNICTVLCKPACEDMRYDTTLSTSEWPNMEFQEYVLRRWTDLISDFVESGKQPKDNETVQLNETFINKNFLRVHLYIQEMNYLQYKDIAAYSLPEMFADLGGCLGLYIGASIITILEFWELLTRILGTFGRKCKSGKKQRTSGRSVASFQRRKMMRVPRSWNSEDLNHYSTRRSRNRNSVSGSKDGPVYWVPEGNQGQPMYNGGIPAPL